MEDILASIRRIIADDDMGRDPEPQEPAPSPLKSVLDLAERQIAPILYSDAPLQDSAGRIGWDAPQGNVFPIDASLSGAVSSLGAEQPAPRAAKSVRSAAVEASGGLAEDILLSGQAESSVSSAFERLGASVPQSQPQTMEDVVKEMMRPMLKAWLDDNLPAIVERLVQAEIERIARGRR